MNLKLNNLFLLILISLSVTAQTARVQVIHNSADASAAQVDVYLNDGMLIDDFAFRTATAFIDAPAGIPIDIEIAPSTSSTSAESIYTLTTTLTAGETYVLVASGIVSASGYSPATPFGIDVFGMGQEMAASSGNTDLLVYHGSTDAPTVDIYEKDAGELAGDAAYGNFAGYLELPTADYYLQVREETGTTSVAGFDAPLATLGLADSAAVVVASGFLDPSMNSDGAAFGLYVALPQGGDLVALPESKARVQVIHNSADAAASAVDVYLNDGLLIDDFAFRTASAFIDAPAGQSISIDIAPGTSASAGESIYNLSTMLDPTKTYVLVASGIVSASGYSPATPFGIDVFDMGQEMAASSGNTDLLVYHGSTDAPTVDIYEKDAGELVDNLMYGDFAGYLALPTQDYTIEVRNEAGTGIVASYQAPLSTLSLQDSAIVVLASGFLDPVNNSNGESFGLYVSLPGGGELLALPIYTNIEERFNAGTKQLNAYPVPAADLLTVEYRIENPGESIIEVFDVTGNRIEMILPGKQPAGKHAIEIGLNNYKEGVYFIRLRTEKSTSMVKVSVAK